MAKTQLILLVALALLVCSVSAFVRVGGWGYRTYGYPVYGSYGYGAWPVYSTYYPVASYGWGYGYPYGFWKK